MNFIQKLFKSRKVNEPMNSALNIPVVMCSLFCIGYKGFWRVTNFIKLMPYPIRWAYWTALYYYNKYKYKSGDFTLKLYRSYAK